MDGGFLSQNRVSAGTAGMKGQSILVPVVVCQRHIFHIPRVNEYLGTVSGCGWVSSSWGIMARLVGKAQAI